jgi:hypothetical protein
MLAGMNISKIAYIHPRQLVVERIVIIWNSVSLNDIPAPAIPKPAQKTAGDRSDQTRCPVNGMRVAIQRYSSYNITQETQSYHPKINH